jgi:autophagy-related protein 2
MAFFSNLSSTIGKKLLLFGLRHIDILDKDPADFVSVDVGKKTTLEVRDVGLHVKVSSGFSCSWHRMF